MPWLLYTHPSLSPRLDTLLLGTSNTLYRPRSVPLIHCFVSVYMAISLLHCRFLRRTHNIFKFIVSRPTIYKIGTQKTNKKMWCVRKNMWLQLHLYCWYFQGLLWLYGTSPLSSSVSDNPPTHSTCDTKVRWQFSGLAHKSFIMVDRIATSRRHLSLGYNICCLNFKNSIYCSWYHLLL